MAVTVPTLFVAIPIVGAVTLWTFIGTRWVTRRLGDRYLRWYLRRHGIPDAEQEAWLAKHAERMQQIRARMDAFHDRTLR